MNFSMIKSTEVYCKTNTHHDYLTLHSIICTSFHPISFHSIRVDTCMKYDLMFNSVLVIIGNDLLNILNISIMVFFILYLSLDLIGYANQKTNGKDINRSIMKGINIPFMIVQVVYLSFFQYHIRCICKIPK